MGPFLISHLAEDLTFQVARGLLTSPRPRHLRELARDYNASPAGISDILARLKKVGVLIEQKQGNRRLFSLQVGAEERECLTKLFKVYELQRVQHQAQRINRRSNINSTKLQDMDEMYLFYRQAKQR